MTWRRRARPPISWRTLGRLLLSRVPLPAAMMAMANSLESIDQYGLMFGLRHTRGGGVPTGSLSSSRSPRAVRRYNPRTYGNPTFSRLRDNFRFARHSPATRRTLALRLSSNGVRMYGPPP